MFSIVRKEFAHSRLRTVSLALAIGATLSTVLVLEGFQSGLLAQLHDMVLARGVDLIAVQPGVTSFLTSRSKLPQLAREEVESVEGVRSAEPMTFVPVIFERNGRKTPIMLLVYDRAGGPRRLRSGRVLSGPKEVIVDASLAVMYGLAPGDTIAISGLSLDVVGLSDGEVAMFTPVVFMSYDGLIDLYFSADVMGDIASLPLVGFLLVSLEAGADPATVQRRIERLVPDVDTFSPEALAASETRMGRTLFGPVLSVLVTVSYLICLMVVALIIYANASARVCTYGVLMALGFRRVQFLAGLILEGLGLTVIALPLALTIAFAVGEAVETWAPLYAIKVAEALPLTRSMLAALTLTIVGAGLAFGPIARLDPAVAFRR